MKMKRKQTGLSLVETMAAMFVSSLIAGAVIGTLSLINSTSFRAYNSLSSITAAKRLEPSLKQEIHMAKFFGDQQGDSSTANSFPALSNPNYVPPPEEGDLTPDSQATIFPIETSNTVWPPRPYYLDEQTLIFQVPVFDNSYSYPELADGQPPASSNGKWDVDTYVYKVLADKNKPGKGQFVLQKTIFKGNHSSNPSFVPPIASNNPQTVMTGIVGPVDPNAATDPIANTPPPLVFSYLIDADHRVGKPTALETANIRGVSVTVELFNNDASARKDYTPSTLAICSEFFKRGNGASD
ncbi:MAG: prepilin-type N-terminal cleavage/methylation domain-containing protein [Cyanobacteria bacterium TGS_CYA1]|nr:prepilin-type N-terminal cleavage/methylation domain-containing protein [Cyanobacteria bacterium TGS_CYA1]